MTHFQILWNSHIISNYKDSEQRNTNIVFLIAKRLPEQRGFENEQKRNDF